MIAQPVVSAGVEPWPYWKIGSTKEAFGGEQAASQFGQPRFAPARVVAAAVPVGRPTLTSSQVVWPTSGRTSSPPGPNEARKGLRRPRA